MPASASEEQPPGDPQSCSGIISCRDTAVGLTTWLPQLITSFARVGRLVR